jgi:hypothetical protein
MRLKIQRSNIFLKEESPVEKENLKFEEKSPNLDVYGLNWIFK